MNATQDCHPVPSTLPVGIYQTYARQAFETASDTELQPWSWILTTCGTWCLNTQHMFTQTPIRIAYPPGVCIYCGDPANTKDHLLPRTMTGTTRRILVAVVPCCASCNSAISDLPHHNVTTRRAEAHRRIRIRKHKILYAMDWTEDQLSELGPSLRHAIEGYQADRALTMARLEWPEDPLYDLAAFQRSGIEDPIALDLIANPFTTHRMTSV